MKEPFLGSIELFAFGYAPFKYMLCDGSMLSIAEYRALFNLIGTQFGGDGITNFALPNMLGYRPLDVTADFMCYYIACQGAYPSHF
jgi:Microcystin-dependent protein